MAQRQHVPLEILHCISYVYRLSSVAKEIKSHRQKSRAKDNVKQKGRAKETKNPSHLQ